MTPPPKLVDADGRPIALDQRIASGGEGAVYSLANDESRVVKVYHTPPTEQTVEKLAAMIALSTDNLKKVTAWPEQLAFDAATQAVAGFVMPRLVDYQPLQHLYNPVQRLKHFPRAGWNFQVRAAMNCAAAFDEVHAAGCLVGDVNQSNILVSPQALVKFIDCDSFQIVADGKHYLCDVGMAHYTPPELQNRSLRGVVRTPNHDRFGLAVLIFQLLFVGRHPYAGIYHGPGDPSFEQLIADYRFAHGPNAANWKMTAPPFTPGFADIPPELGKLFQRAFERAANERPESEEWEKDWEFDLGGGASGEVERPTAIEWMDVLKALEAEIVECANDDGHIFWKRSAGCPWCRMEKAGGPEYYFGVTARFVEFIPDEVKLLQIERRLSSIDKIVLVYARRNYLPITDPTPKPVKESTGRHRTLKIVSSGLFCMSMCYGLLCVLLAARVDSIFFYFFPVSLILDAVSFMLAFILFYNTRFSEAKCERAKTRREAYNRMEIWELKYRATYRKHCKHYDTEHSELSNIISKLKSIKQQEQQEIAAQTNRDLDIARKRFLQLHAISDSTIPEVSVHHKATLAILGILTANDVQADRLRNVPDLGVTAAMNLIHWREDLLLNFRFTQTRSLTLQERAAIANQFRLLEQQLFQEFDERSSTLEEIAKKTRHEIEAFEQQLFTAVAEWRQAVVDDKIMDTK